MSVLSVPLALIAAAVAGQSAPSQSGPGGGWLDPVVLRGRPLLDQPGGARPGLAFDARGRGVTAFVADGATGPRIAVAPRARGRATFGEVTTLPVAPDLRVAGGRAPVLAAGANGTFAVAWLARTSARGAPAVVVAVRRAQAGAFGAPVRLSAAGARPLGAPPAVAVDTRGRVTVAWAQRRRGGAVLVVRVRGRDARFAPAHPTAPRGAPLGPPAGAGPAVGWAQRGRLLVRIERRRIDLGASAADRPELAATADGARLAVAWRDGARVRVTVPGLQSGAFATAGRVVAGPLVGVDATGLATVAWQDERGVLAATVGRRAQRVAATDQGELLSGLAVGAGGQALVTVLDPVPSSRSDAGDQVTAALRPAGGAFRKPIALSRPGRFTSHATPAITPAGTALVAWASGVPVPREALMLVATHPFGAAGSSSRTAPSAGALAL